AELEFEESIRAIASGPTDSSLLIAVGSSVRAWDRHSSRFAFELPHECEITNLTLSPERQLALTTTRSDRTFLWDLERAELLCPMEENPEQLAFLDRGRVAVARDNSVVIEPIRPGELATAARERVHRTLTATERRRYLPDEPP